MGDLDDPKFTLTGEGTLQTAVAVVKAFGASFEGLVRALPDHRERVRRGIPRVGARVGWEHARVI
jgi:hypothetical protein